MTKAIKVEEFKSGPFNPIGTTTILWGVKHRLNITLAEYSMLDFISKSKKRKRPIKLNRIYNHFAMQEEQAKNILRGLLNKGFIERTEKGIILTKKWTSEFTISDEEFDEFWLNEVTTKVDWPGARKGSLEKYKIARKKFSKEHLLLCKKWYFLFLGLEENKFRKKMGATVFLNVNTERFNENWKEQHDAIIAARAPAKKSKAVSMTEEERNRKFH